MDTDKHTQNTQETQAVGNTSQQPERKRKWCLTLNNWTPTEYDSILNTINTRNYKYIIGKEIGESGTPHLQVYIEGKNAISFKTLKAINVRLHIESSRGTREQNINYCSKEGNYTTNLPLTFALRCKSILDSEYKDFEPREFQKDVLRIIDEKPDNRKICWFYEDTGNVGKSYLCKYIALKYKGVIIADGKKADVCNQVLQCISERGEEPRIIILDIPRHNREYINYGILESLKNGCIYSGKYEGGQCLFNIPHVIIFSNDEPDREKWSTDRYKVVEI